MNIVCRPKKIAYFYTKILQKQWKLNGLRFMMNQAFKGVSTNLTAPLSQALFQSMFLIWFFDVILMLQYNWCYNDLNTIEQSNQ